MLLTLEKWYKHYKANEDRINLSDGLLFQTYYGETAQVEHYQILVAKQLVAHVLWSRNGELHKQLGSTETNLIYKKYH